MTRQKRVAAIHDISGFGKCSLTVALPIISAAGITTSCIPTAVLSTHTGGFTGYTCRDLTSDIMPIANHWKSLGLDFDAIYSGYLGSAEQISILCEIIDKFRTDDNIIIVDPAMADNGKMYPLFDMNYAHKMSELCSKADLIVPNMTEAAFLLGDEYKAGPYDKQYIEGVLKRLAEKGPRRICLTGVYFDSYKLGAACYDSKTEKISYSLTEKIPGMYHGTGDVFASVLTAALVRGKTLEDAAQIAAVFTANSIKRTSEAGTDSRYGVAFEQELPDFIRMLEL